MNLLFHIPVRNDLRYSLKMCTVEKYVGLSCSNQGYRKFLYLTEIRKILRYFHFGNNLQSNVRWACSFQFRFRLFLNFALE